LGVTQYLLDKIDLDAVMPLVCRFIHRDWLSDGKSTEDDALDRVKMTSTESSSVDMTQVLEAKKSI
jgi:hypothetical protein